MQSIAVATFLSVGLTLVSVASSAATCQAMSGSSAPVLVELYTSEGCSSCPPADHWLSSLKGRNDVIPLAYHVDYWDSASWRDRFAQPAFSQRQDASRRTTGARFSYTPQVVVDGRDAPERPFPELKALGGKASPPVSLKLVRNADELELTVLSVTNFSSNTKGFVAVVDDGLTSNVKGGENRGATLRHDAVVRELVPWSAAGASQTIRVMSTSVPEAGATRHWVAFALDDSGKPVQAVSLRCQ